MTNVVTLFIKAFADFNRSEEAQQQALRSQITAQNDLNADYEAKIADYDKRIAARDQTIQNLNDLITQQREDIARLNADLKKLRT